MINLWQTKCKQRPNEITRGKGQVRALHKCPLPPCPPARLLPVPQPICLWANASRKEALAGPASAALTLARELGRPRTWSRSRRREYPPMDGQGRPPAKAASAGLLGEAGLCPGPKPMTSEKRILTTAAFAGST